MSQVPQCVNSVSSGTERTQAEAEAGCEERGYGRDAGIGDRFWIGDYIQRPCLSSQGRCSLSLDVVLFLLTICVFSYPGKERKSIYIAPFWPRWYTQSAQAWITQFYLQITPCLPFLRQRSPDVTTTATEAADIQLQLTTYLSTPKG